MQEMKIMHPMATPTPTLRSELAGSEIDVGRVELVVLLAVPVCSSLRVVSVAVEFVMLYSGSHLLFRIRSFRLQHRTPRSPGP